MSQFDLIDGQRQDGRAAMSRFGLTGRLFGFALLMISGAAAAQGGNIMGPYPGVSELSGPALVCGHGFALRLSEGERARRQEGPDFFLYYIDASDGAFLLYEGGHPQPHDDSISLSPHWLVAIHDNRSAEARARSAVRDRLLTGPAFSEACPQQRSSQ